MKHEAGLLADILKYKSSRCEVQQLVLLSRATGSVSNGNLSTLAAKRAKL